MRRWVIYAGGSALLVGLSAIPLSFLFEPRVRLGVWIGLTVAWMVQAAAFGILIFATRQRPNRVVAGWTVGTFIRLVALSALAWLTLSGAWALPPEPTLLALAGGLFVLLLLEPFVFRYHLEAR